MAERRSSADGNDPPMPDIGSYLVQHWPIAAAMRPLVSCSTPIKAKCRGRAGPLRIVIDPSSN